MAEYWDSYNEKREPLGRTVERGQVLGALEYYLSCEIWIQNHKGEFLITKRHPDKKAGGLWEFVGGGVLAGETTDAAAVREVFEEIGVELSRAELQLLATYTKKNYFMDIYWLRKEIDLKETCLCPTETVDIRWVAANEVERMIDEGEMVYSVGLRYRMYQEQLREKNARYQQMAKELGAVFCKDGIFSEMSMLLSEYEHKPMAVPESIHFAFYEGALEKLRVAVAAVDEEWVQYFQAGDKVFCAYDGEEIASFCIVEENADCLLSDGVTRIGSIGCVGTVPKYRKQGIGLAMVAKATEYIKQQGCDKGFIHYTHLEHWYSRLGYRTFARFSMKEKES